MKNEFEEAMEQVLDYGLKAIDSLEPDQLKQVMDIFEGVK